MDKETLSQYGWVVIVILVLVIMITLASPFGSFIADNFTSAYESLDHVSDSSMKTLKVTPGQKQAAKAAKFLAPASVAFSAARYQATVKEDVQEDENKADEIAYIYACDIIADPDINAHLEPREGIIFDVDEVIPNGYYSSGTKVYAKDAVSGEILQEYILVVLGDADCFSGVVDVMDLVIAMRLSYSQVTAPDAAAILSADINRDGVVTRTDDDDCDYNLIKNIVFDDVDYSGGGSAAYRELYNKYVKGIVA